MTIKRDSSGKFLKGCCPNPGGRPKKDEFLNLLEELYGEKCESLHAMIFCLFHDLEYKSTMDLSKIIKKITNKTLKKNLKKAKKTKYGLLSGKEKVELIKWLIEQRYGKPESNSNIKADIDNDLHVTVELPTDLDIEDF